MRIIKNVIIILILFTSCNSQIKTILKDKKIIESKIAVGNLVIETNDKNLVIAGLTQKSNYHSRGAVHHGSSVLLKTDKRGTKIWEREHDFLKHNIIFDMIELKNSNLLIISSVDNYYPYLNFDKKTYLTLLNEKGDIISQKIFEGSLRKIIEAKNENLFFVGFHKGRYDTDIEKKIYTPFLLHTNAEGDIKWSKEIDTEVNFIDNMKFSDNQLYINCAFYQKESIKRMVIKYTDTFSIEEWYETINAMPLDTKDTTITYANKSKSNDDNWTLQIKDNKTGNTHEIDLEEYTNQPIIPQIKLRNFHVCYQLYETTPNNSMVVKSGDDWLITTIIATNKVDKSSQTSVSTQAYCDNESKGIFVVKINNNFELQWMKFIEKNAIPMDVIETSKGEIIIIGTMFDKNTSRETLLLESLSMK